MNLKELAKLRGTNLKRISEQTQIPASTLYAISQGETTFDNVGVSRFLKLADALGMTAEQLHALPNVTPENVDSYIGAIDDSGMDAELSDVYGTLDEQGRAALLTMARALARK